MNELISLSSQLHLVFIVVCFRLILSNIYLLRSDRTFFNLSKRLELLAPQYYIVLAAIFFTGIIVMAVRQFSFSLSVWLMIAVWIGMLVLGIKAHKRYKTLERSEASQDAYKRFALKKYSIDLILLVVTSLFFYGIH